MKVKYCQSLLLLVPLFLNLVFSKSVAAQTASPLELKAVLIYKMGFYIKGNNSPSIKNYCFVGEKGKVISEVLIRMAKARQLQKTINITNEPTIDKFDRHQCQVLYTADIPNNMEQKLVSLSRSTLTIVDNASQLKQGAIVSIEIQGKKSTLYTSLSNLKNSDIEIHSRLLSIMTKLD